jgi:hypothetical protein
MPLAALQPGPAIRTLGNLIAALFQCWIVCNVFAFIWQGPYCSYLSMERGTESVLLGEMRFLYELAILPWLVASAFVCHAPFEVQYQRCL